MQDSSDRQVLSVTTTVGSLADARTLARAILERRLAACVQVEEGLTSFYRWAGQDCEDAEARLTIKTLPACEPALLALFAQAHPYEVPQFLSATLRASQAYYEWVRGEVTLPEEDPRESPGS